jgi:hypothetical protein
MFFGFSRKRRNRNRKKQKNGKNRVTYKNKKGPNNIKFNVEELDTPPSPSRLSIKTIETDSLSPIILSNSRSNTRSRNIRSSSSSMSRSSSSSSSSRRRKIQMRTPTPYYRNESHSSSKSSPSLNSSGDIILFFMDMLTTVKLYHWKTFNYATHKATDELYEDLNKYVDEFVEVMIGHKGGVRASLPRSNVKIHDCNSPDEFKRKIEEYKRVLIGFTSRFEGTKNSDLLNIRDEILASLNKTVYLLSFK